MTKFAEIKGLDEFIKTHEAAVLSVPIDESGTIHSAGLLYAHAEDPLRFIFITSSNTEKCKLLLKKDRVTGSCVVGTEKGVPFSLQMRGRVVMKQLVETSQELDVYEAKRGKRSDDVSDSDQVVLIFEPDWARCTDYVSSDFADGFTRHQIDLS